VFEDLPDFETLFDRVAVFRGEVESLMGENESGEFVLLEVFFEPGNLFRRHVGIVPFGIIPAVMFQVLGVACIENDEMNSVEIKGIVS